MPLISLLSGTLPSVDTHIPGIGKVGGWTLNTPDIPLLAAGGIITRGGAAVVGERGPEMLTLPRGAAVQPLSLPSGAAGAAAGDTTARAGGAPDISQLTPRERFDRLFNRIMQAAEQGDTAQVRRFTPMALGAYAQLDTIDVDARYHAAVIRLQTGDVASAHALADTILEQSPNHLFGYIVRGTAATLADDPGARSQAEREFLRRYDREMAAGRPEYRDHAQVIEEFRKEAVGRSGGQADGNKKP